MALRSVYITDLPVWDVFSTAPNPLWEVTEQ